MENTKQSKSFLFGLAAGIVAGAAAIAVIRGLFPAQPGEILAEVRGEKLTRSELREKISADMIPIENDEYRVLERGVNEWINGRLLEKEARAQGKTLEQLYAQELWAKAQVTYEEITNLYKANPELFGGQAFDAASSAIASQLRAQKYTQAKETYLDELRKKYGVKVYLKPPKSFVKGLAIPLGTPFPGAPAPGTPPPALPGVPAPSLPAKAVEAKSQPGSFPSKGPESAPVTLMDFSDFHCGFCKQVAPTLEKLAANYPDKVRLVFRHFPLSKAPGSGSFPTHEAAACAQEQGKFWEYHDAIYAFSGAPQENDLKTMAQQIGLDLARFDECRQSKRYQSTILADVKEGEQKGVQGTPTIFVNNQAVNGAFPYDHFVSVIEGILTGKPVPAAAPPAAAPTPPPAPAAIVKFDDLEGHPSVGPKNAPVTLVEFSDFFCPFCQKVTPTLEQLMKNYSGKIRRVWRHYPLAFHTGSDRAHEASECAHEQGKFWEYHDKLFANLGGSHDDSTLIRFAQEVKADKKKFEKCLSSGKYKDLVQKEIAKGSQSGVQGTPAVFVNGQLVSGAYPYEHFEGLVKAELAKKS